MTGSHLQAANNAPAVPPAVPPPASEISAQVWAAVDAVVALVVASLASSALSASSQTLPAWLRSDRGAMDLLAALATSVLYARRFRPWPRLTWPGAVALAGADLSYALSPAAALRGVTLVAGPMALLLAAHVCAGAATAAVVAARGSGTAWASCLSPGALLWGPLAEAVLGRWLLPALVVQRAGVGAGASAALVGAGAFTALRLAAAPSLADALLPTLVTAVTGACWGALAARTGSLLLPTALHALNQALALAWAAGDGLPGCAAAPLPPPLQLALAATLVAYVTAGAWLLRSLAAEGAAGGAASFRARHPLPFAYLNADKQD